MNYLELQQKIHELGHSDFIWEEPYDEFLVFGLTDYNYLGFITSPVLFTRDIWLKAQSEINEKYQGLVLRSEKIDDTYTLYTANSLFTPKDYVPIGIRQIIIDVLFK